MKKELILTLFVASFSLAVFAQQAVQKYDVATIDSVLAKREASVSGIKSGNEAGIIWANHANHKKTAIAFVYLHGFGASKREGGPVMRKLSAKYAANVYEARLSEHGIDRVNAYEFLTPENYIASAKEAVAIGKMLGDHVIVVSTSTGGTLGLTLAADDHEIAGLVLYSPFIGLINTQIEVVLTPEGKAGFIKMNGSEVTRQNRPEEEAKFWSTSYHVNGYVALLKMVKTNMVANTFEKVKCPVFVGYYYKNEQEQDKVVSVPAILKMFSELGTSNKEKVKLAFSEVGDHVIACDIRSRDWQSVFDATTLFLDEQFLKK
ncbi:MAG: esterase/lipase [Flavobacteriales bacterium]|jgi:esterase/lipase